MKGFSIKHSQKSVFCDLFDKRFKFGDQSTAAIRNSKTSILPQANKGFREVWPVWFTLELCSDVLLSWLRPVAQWRKHIMSEAFSENAASSPEYTQDWFSSYIPVWDRIIAQEKPSKILEIGSFEGRSACYLIEKCATLADSEILITCVDTWEGSIEHRPGAAAAAVMSDVERRFDHNTRLALAKAAKPVALRKLKRNSRDALAGLIAEGALESFDLIYIDGSHEAPDVLADATMAFPLLRIGGILIFDDYLWSMQRPGTQDVLLMPKLAIDAFMNIYQRKMLVFQGLPLRQLYARKVSA